MSPASIRALVLTAGLVAPTMAAADEAPPEQNIVCSGKKVGDTCEADGLAGSCVADQCSKLDYSQGTPPKIRNYDCLACRANPPAPPPAAEPAAATPEPTPSRAAQPAAQPPPPAQPAASSGVCNVTAGARPPTTWLFVFALVAWRRRGRVA